MNYEKRIASLVEQLKATITAREKVEMEARVAAQLGSLLNGIGSATARIPARAGTLNTSAPKKRGPGKGNPRLKAKLKSYWANLSPADRKARVAKMQAGRKK